MGGALNIQMGLNYVKMTKIDQRRAYINLKGSRNKNEAEKMEEEEENVYGIYINMDGSDAGGA